MIKNDYTFDYIDLDSFLDIYEFLCNIAIVHESNFKTNGTSIISCTFDSKDGEDIFKEYLKK